jgi:hypothetical protein
VLAIFGRLGGTLKSDLKVGGAKEGFDSLSPYIRKILREYMYGHGSDQRDLFGEFRFFSSFYSGTHFPITTPFFLHTACS